MSIVTKPVRKCAREDCNNEFYTKNGVGAWNSFCSIGCWEYVMYEPSIFEVDDWMNEHLRPNPFGGDFD